MIRAGKLAAAIAVAAIAGVNATNVDAGPIFYTGTAYTENFESLGWLKDGARTVWVDGSTVPGWYASVATYVYGSSGTGVTYSGRNLFSYRSGSDSAFGSQNASSGIPFLRFGAQIVNNTGTRLSGFTLSYVGEQWHVSSEPGVQQLSFDYALDAPSLTSGNYVAVAALNFLSPFYESAAGPPGINLDGNLPENRVAISAQVTGLNWDPGERLWLRWTDIDDQGWDFGSGLAIDDLVFTATEFASPAVETVSAGLSTPQASMSIAEPSTGWLAGLCIAALAVVTRRPGKRKAPQRRVTK